MLQNSEIIYQPVFFLFIALTIFISLAFSWGRRKNKKIALYFLNQLKEIIQPQDQQYTNIGGFIGYHAYMIPRQQNSIEKIEVTITLLPRQSLLYYPISLLTRRYDRFYMTVSLNPDQIKEHQFCEGHIIEKAYSQFRGPKISNMARLNKSEIMIEKNPYLLFSENDSCQEKLTLLAGLISEYPYIKHLAFVPDDSRIFVFLVPRIKTGKEALQAIINWISSLFE